MTYLENKLDYKDDSIHLMHGDCLERMKDMQSVLFSHHSDNLCYY
jgi:hypothetical protein